MAWATNTMLSNWLELNTSARETVADVGLLLVVSAEEAEAAVPDNLLMRVVSAEMKGAVNED
jgi:hypothetical protein